jgi:para-aminobenzoate synthetase component I
MTTSSYHVDNIQFFTKQALQWASFFNSACCFHSQGYQKGDPYSKFDVLIAAGVKEELVNHENGITFATLETFLKEHPNEWIPGFLSYDLKNEIEDLSTSKPNLQGTPLSYFFIPRHFILIKGDQIEIRSDDPAHLFKEITTTTLIASKLEFDSEIKTEMNEEIYTAVFNKLINHIHQGNIYEINLCLEFYAEEVKLDPLHAFWQLSMISPTPFSCYFKQHDQYIISASPERFLARRRDLLISQPIKGTAPRGRTSSEDALLIRDLQLNKKEISENIMIVDLVRNDLTKSAAPATVEVKELMGVYSFRQVHQLISTISCRERDGLPLIESIRNTFPAGSMTGAPKISAMRLIDNYELTRRGIYAGSVGYFAPDGDYDFNVVIRSLNYNAKSNRLSFHVGSAVTAEASASQEYQECLWKAQAILDLLKPDC